MSRSYREPDTRRRAFRPEAQALEARQLLAAAAVAIEPTAEEQYMLQLVNRARSDPSAEARRLLGLARHDEAIRPMLRLANLPAFARIMTRTHPLPPLAFNPRLIEAARDQDAAMLVNNDQKHSLAGYLTDARVSQADDGQAYFPVGAAGWALGENLFAYSRNVNKPTLTDYVDYLHAGLMLDWGNPDFGHLRNLLAPGPGQARAGDTAAFREIGIGLLTNANPNAPPPGHPGQPANSGLNVGPVLVTQEFGWNGASLPKLVGAAYDDRDGNHFYTPGEGLGGVVITAVGLNGEGTYQTTTWASGGYSLDLPPGTYVVSANGGGDPGAWSKVLHIADDNVAWDPGVVGTPAPSSRRLGRSGIKTGPTRSF